MSWPTRSLRAAGLIGIAAGIGLALTAAAGGANAALQVRPQARDTVRNEDLRCLTRRPGDCLDAPVSRDEPHGALCATCHDMWSPSVPANVTRSCTDAGCHSGAASLSTFHRTVHADALADCVHCHTAHAFRVPENGEECRACHKGGGTRVEWVDARSSHGLAAPAAFAHVDHELVACSRCHGSGDQHGTLTVVTLEDCRSCHHDSRNPETCDGCHAAGLRSGAQLMVTRSLDIRIGSLDRPLRLLPFDHTDHGSVACTDCHTRGSGLRTAAGADCSGCHLQHHEATSDCSLCHEPPAPGAHDAESHLGCAGAGCHANAPEAIRGAPRTRALCLACHTDRGDHKPDKTCSDCHRLPQPRSPG